MKALSVKMPWALAIIDLDDECAEELRMLKTCENRAWGPKDYFGPVAIHASKEKATEASIDEVIDTWHDDYSARTGDNITGAMIDAKRAKLKELSDKYRGYVLGWTAIVDVDEEMKTEWDVEGLKHIRLGSEPRRLAEPFEFRGRQGLWDLDDELVRDAGAFDEEPTADADTEPEAREDAEPITDEESDDLEAREDFDEPEQVSPAIEINVGDRVVFKERTLPVPLSEEDELEARRDAGRVYDDIVALEREKKQVNKELGTAIDGKKKELTQANEYANQGKTQEKVRCLELTDYENGRFSVVRLDAHKIIEDRELTTGERQFEIGEQEDEEFMGEESPELKLDSLQLAAIDLLAMKIDPEEICQRLDLTMESLDKWRNEETFRVFLVRAEERVETETPEDEERVEGARGSLSDDEPATPEQVLDALSCAEAERVERCGEGAVLEVLRGWTDKQRDDVLYWADDYLEAVAEFNTGEIEDSDIPAPPDYLDECFPEDDNAAE